MLATMGYITPEQLVREYELMCFFCVWVLFVMIMIKCGVWLGVVSDLGLWL